MTSWAERATAVYPGGSGTFSKARSQFPANAPEFAARGRAAHVIGSDDRDYIDWTMGLGAISLGYLDRDVTAAVMDQIALGSIYGLPTTLEIELAEEVAALCPWPDAMVRFGKNGSDATAAAVRAARAITSRDLVLSDGYHGWLVDCPNTNGVPAAERMLVDRLGSLDQPAEKRPVAAVIVEPDLIERRQPGGLAALRKWCDHKGALLIFDEVLTGFRIDLRFAAHYYGVMPDLIASGKAAANGWPLSIVAGPAKYMHVFDGKIGFSFTFAGETTAIAAALATVRKMKREPVIEKLWTVGHEIQEHWNREAEWLKLPMRLEGLAPRTVVAYPTLAHRTLVSQEMIRRGILWTVGATACYAHTDDDIGATKQAISETLSVVASTKDPASLVQGPLVAAAYRKP